MTKPVELGAGVTHADFLERQRQRVENLARYEALRDAARAAGPEALAAFYAEGQSRVDALVAARRAARAAR